MKSILEVKDLKKYYKENTAVNGLEFNLYDKFFLAVGEIKKPLKTDSSIKPILV